MLNSTATQFPGAPLPTAATCFSTRRTMPKDSNACSAKKIIVSTAESSGTRIWPARSTRSVPLPLKTTKNSWPSSRARNSSNVPSANFGWRRTKAVITWPASASSIFATNAAECTWSANASKRPGSKWKIAAGPSNNANSRKPTKKRLHRRGRRRSWVKDRGGKKRKGRERSRKDRGNRVLLGGANDGAAFNFWNTIINAGGGTVLANLTLLPQIAVAKRRALGQIWHWAHHDAVLLHAGTGSAPQIDRGW